jgi:hypothetical protein
MSFMATQLVGFGVGDSASYAVALATDEDFTRTFGSAGNRRQAALSLWIRRTADGTTQTIYAVGAGATNVTRSELQFDTSNRFVLAAGGGGAHFITNQTQTADGLWHHVLFHWDNANATASLRARIWYDGAEVVSFNTDNRSGLVTTADYAWNNTVVNYIGRGGDSAARFISADLAQVHYFDAVLPAIGTLYSGGVPVPYTGSYGTNGGRLLFNAANDLGDDSSGNDLDWTLVNISAADQLTNGPP